MILRERSRRRHDTRSCRPEPLDPRHSLKHRRSTSTRIVGMTTVTATDVMLLEHLLQVCPRLGEYPSRQEAQSVCARNRERRDTDDPTSAKDYASSGKHSCSGKKRIQPSTEATYLVIGYDRERKHCEVYDPIRRSDGISKSFHLSSLVQWEPHSLAGP